MSCNVWLLAARATPEERGELLVVTNGKGRLSVQTLLPEEPAVKLFSGDDLYSYGAEATRPRGSRRARCRSVASKCRRRSPARRTCSCTS